MLGSIIGDIVGTPWEYRRTKTKDFPMFNGHHGVTDDSIMTIAVADALMHEKDPAKTLREWNRALENTKKASGVGQLFSLWLAAPKVQPPYDGDSSGAAMRVSPSAWLGLSLVECLNNADRVTRITHSHPEGRRGALATAHAIWLALNGCRPDRIREEISRIYAYNMERSVDEIRPGYRYAETALGTVPEALICALESDSFEDALRNAISLGGDANALAAIAGSLAEALHGIPPEIVETSLEYLPAEMQEVIADFDGRD